MAVFDDEIFTTFLTKHVDSKHVSLAALCAKGAVKKARQV